MRTGSLPEEAPQGYVRQKHFIFHYWDDIQRLKTLCRIFGQEAFVKRFCPDATATVDNPERSLQARQTAQSTPESLRSALKSCPFLMANVKVNWPCETFITKNRGNQ
jgi:hypothetical protein